MLGQEIPTLEAEIGKSYDFLGKRQTLWSTCDSLIYGKLLNLTPKEATELENACDEIEYSEACDGPWSIICGNDWVDEGYTTADIRQPDYKFCEVSSALKPYKNNTYNENSISDLNYETAWLEGVRRYGIGETVTFNFKAWHPRITKVIIANGYVKNKTAWKNNSRVQQLKMCLNDKPFAILNLEDVYAKQTFNIPTIGYVMYYNDDGSTWYYIDGKGNKVKTYGKEVVFSTDQIKFEILSVYKGDKYQDTAITEIYFDGLDVH